jgi:hypothetical protein
MLVTRCSGPGFLWALLLSSALAFAPISQAQSSSYIAEMPSVAKVQRQIVGLDQIDTLAQQAVAFEVLKDMARVQIGNPDALNNMGALSSAERELLQGYLAAQRAIFATPGVDRDAINQRALVYGATPQFPQAVAQQFFSAAWLKDYEKKFEAYTKIVQQRSAASAPPAQPDPDFTLPPVADIITGWIKQLAVLALVIGGFVWVVKRMRSGSKAPARAGEQELARFGAT